MTTKDSSLSPTTQKDPTQPNGGNSLVAMVGRYLSELLAAILAGLVELCASFTAAVLSHPAVQQAGAEIMVQGMNQFVKQPDLNETMQIMSDTMAKTQEDFARSAGEGFPKLAGKFLEGMLSPKKNPSKPTKSNPTADHSTTTTSTDPHALHSSHHHDSHHRHRLPSKDQSVATTTDDDSRNEVASTHSHTSHPKQKAVHKQDDKILGFMWPSKSSKPHHPKDVVESSFSETKKEPEQQPQDPQHKQQPAPKEPESTSTTPNEVSVHVSHDETTSTKKNPTTKQEDKILGFIWPHQIHHPSPHPTTTTTTTTTSQQESPKAIKSLDPTTTMTTATETTSHKKDESPSPSSHEVTLTDATVPPNHLQLEGTNDTNNKGEDNRKDEANCTVASNTHSSKTTKSGKESIDGRSASRSPVLRPLVAKWAAQLMPSSSSAPPSPPSVLKITQTNKNTNEETSTPLDPNLFLTSETELTVTTMEHPEEDEDEVSLLLQPSLGVVPQPELEDSHRPTV